MWINIELEKQILRSVLKTSNVISSQQNSFDHTVIHSPVISANLRGTAANCNLKLMNYGVHPHWVHLHFPCTVRMDYLLNDFMRGKKLELRIWSQQWLLWRFIAMDNVNIPPCLIISAAEATVGQPMGFLVILYFLCPLWNESDHKVAQKNEGLHDNILISDLMQLFLSKPLWDLPPIQVASYYISSIQVQ